MPNTPDEPEVTPVVFRAFPQGEVIALFPAIAGGRCGQCSSYMHVGQHGAADYGHVISITRPAELDEYEPLLRELVEVGYAPQVCLRERPWIHPEGMRQLTIN
jgi:hypothetical protein